VAKPGFSLEDHWNDGEARKAIARGGWTFVILQQGPSALPESRVLLEEYVRRFDAEIRRVHARTALYMVWPSAARSGDFDAVRASYASAAALVGGTLLAAGDAWRAAWRLDPGLHLYGPDLFHPTPAGSLLAAMAIFHGVTGHEPPAITVRGVSAHEVEILRHAVRHKPGAEPIARSRIVADGVRSPEMKISRAMSGAMVAAVVVMTVVSIRAQQPRPMSPRGSSAAHVLGTWATGGRQTFAAGRGTYQNGKWIEIDYGRPLKRGRTIFGSGANYGASLLIGAPIWRAGADVTTRLRSEVPLTIGGKTVAAGEYSVFVDLKENNWTFVLSTWPAQQTYDPNNHDALWGAYNYTPDKDLVRAKMTLETLPHAHEQLSWEFVDVTNTGGSLALAWDRTQALVGFTF
jgi:hypothetical protein